MMSSGQLNVADLVTHEFDFEKAVDAYDLLTNDRSALGILLKYNEADGERYKRTLKIKTVSQLTTPLACKVSLGVIGAGNYASRILIPAFKKAGCHMHSVSTSGGINSVIHGEKNNFDYATTETKNLIENKEINTVAIVTQHKSHARFAVDAINAGKHVFVEKPLAINHEELKQLEDALAANSSEKPVILMVNFNRRFSPLIQK